ncbi:MAG: PilZ domain-containing protein [bacterium]|nr:PilZ domain-containing protein [bacterium]
MSSERRHFHRIPFEHSVKLDLPKGEQICQLIDLSLKGALVHCEAPLEISKGDKCQFSIQLDGANASIDTSATLVFQEGLQNGFRFDEINIDSLTHLRRLVELNSGDPEQVRQELFFIAEQH